MSDIVLHASNVGKTFGQKTVLTDCNLDVSAGEICGVIGPNGAGKTTLLKILCMLAYPTVGSVRINAQEATSQSMNDLLPQLGVAFEAPQFQRRTTAAEVLQQHMFMVGAPAPSRKQVENQLERVGLPGSADSLASTFSLGMRQRLALARATMHSPRLLILDEPLNGLDPTGIGFLREYLREAASDGTAIIVASHILSEVEKTCDSVVAIVQGTTANHKRIDQLEGVSGSKVDGYYSELNKGA